MCLLSNCTLTDMAAHLRILLILTALTGIHSITTVSKVSVKAGGSISIPCFYDAKYRNNVKYLCKGSNWNFCSYAVKTNQQNSGKFLISDDKNRRIFTVTINDLTGGDADYWCAVEINRGPDEGAYFHLSVTGGPPILYVDRREITGFIGEQITINCHNRNSGEIKWCKLGGSCVTKSPRSFGGTRVTINTSNRDVFTVTMSGLGPESSGWYWCVRGDLQMPVYVTVTQKPTTTTIATTTTQTTTRLTTISATSEPLNPTTGFAEKTSPTVQDEQQNTSSHVKDIIIPLSLLIFAVMVALFIWFILKKQKQAKETSAATAATPNAESNVDVVYSEVTVRPRNRTQMAKANDEDVIYSTLA